MILRLLARLACLSSLVLTACGDDGKTSDTSATTPSTTGATDSPSTGATDSPSTGAPTTDDPTTGGGAGVMLCIEECASDDDCKAMGMDLGLTCQNKICTGGGGGGGCEDDFDCTVTFSGWAIPCSPQMMCPPNFACIDIGGEGRCATTPTPEFPCATLMQGEIQATTLDGMSVTVCGNTDFECQEGLCLNPCEADADCTNPDLPKCNTGTGQCECTSDADCKTAGSPVCKTTFCGCGSDADCTGANGFNSDTCYDGLCGCSGDATCTQKAFDGTTISCKSF